MKGDRKTVSIPEELFEKIGKRVKMTGFSSVDEYVTFALEQIVSEEESEKKLNDADEAEIKRRLKSLGYFDGGKKQK